MADTYKEGAENQQTQLVSLIDVLHIAPRLYELLPLCSRQNLFATCSHLHKWVRARTTCVRVRHLHDLSALAPMQWPDLVEVWLEAENEHTRCRFCKKCGTWMFKYALE